MEDYTTIVHKDIHEGILFKYKKMNPVEVIGLATRNISFSGVAFGGSDIESMIQLCLTKVLWSKDNGVTWTPIIDAEGNAKLPELDSCPEMGLDLFYRFRKDVLSPVFTESKTFQNTMSRKSENSPQDK